MTTTARKIEHREILWVNKISLHLRCHVIISIIVGIFNVISRVVLQHDWNTKNDHTNIVRMNNNNQTRYPKQHLLQHERGRPNWMQQIVHTTIVPMRITHARRARVWVCGCGLSLRLVLQWLRRRRRRRRWKLAAATTAPRRRKRRW